MEIQFIQQQIYEIRGMKVMLVPIFIGINLANLYEVENRALKQTVKRNLDRFHSPDSYRDYVQTNKK